MKTSVFCQIGIIVSLLCVSLISGTLIRHLIQIIPLIMLVIMSRQKNSWQPLAALSIFSFWLLIVFFIWLYLLGIAKIVQGHFTTGEIILTILIGICSIAGLINSIKTSTIKNNLAKIFLLTAIITLSLIFMYVWQLGNILNNYHHPIEITTAALIGLLLVLCIVTTLKNSSSHNPLGSGLVIFIFSFIQTMAMWVSFQQLFAYH
jgi:hypothetical protein